LVKKELAGQIEQFYVMHVMVKKVSENGKKHRAISVRWSPAAEEEIQVIAFQHLYGVIQSMSCYRKVP